MFEDKIKEINKEIMSVTPISSEKRVYTVDEIQDILGISKTTAYHLVKQKKFRCVKVGGHYRISKISFDLWLDELEQDMEVLVNE